MRRKYEEYGGRWGKVGERKGMRNKRKRQTEDDELMWEKIYRLNTLGPN